MIIDYNNIVKQKVENMRGGDNFVYIQKYNTDDVLMARITIPPMASIGIHKHIDDNEYVYIEEGSGECLVNDKWEIIKKGFSHLSLKGKIHSIKNNSLSDLVIIAYIYK